MLSRRLLLSASAAGWAWPVPAATTPPLRLGVMPFMTPTSLLDTVRPLRQHLERSLARPVDPVTGKDFRQFAHAVQRGDFELALLPANLARLAMLDWHWHALATSEQQLAVLVAVPATSTVQQLAQLAGQRVGSMEALITSAAAGRRWLQERHLVPPPLFSTVPSTASGLLQMQHDVLDALVVADTQLAAQPVAARQAVRTLPPLGQIPGSIWVARPDSSTEERRRWGAALLAYVPAADRPASVINRRMVVPSGAVLSRLDVPAAAARQVLAGR